MATELFKEVMLGLVEDYADIRDEFLENVKEKKVRMDDINTFNFKEYVDAYIGFITVEASELDYDDVDDEGIEEPDEQIEEE